MYENYKSDFIDDMLSCGALRFGDFTTKSGRRSPYFINTGAFDTGRLIGRLGSYYAACIMDNIKEGNIPPRIDVLFGPAYKGIPLAAVTAAALYSGFGIEAGFAFNRKEVKDHGEGGGIVGRHPSDGDNIIILDDVITAGTAAREIIPVIRQSADVNITGMIISVDRMERGTAGLSAVEELRRALSIYISPIITVMDILGRAEPEDRRAIESYLAEYSPG